MHYRLGLLFGDTGRPGDALMCFDRVLQMQPDNVRAHNNRGSALQRLDRTAEAEAAFRRAVALDPDQSIPYINLGRILGCRTQVQGRGNLPGGDRTRCRSGNPWPPSGRGHWHVDRSRAGRLGPGHLRQLRTAVRCATPVTGLQGAGTIGQPPPRTRQGPVRYRRSRLRHRIVRQGAGQGQALPGRCGTCRRRCSRCRDRATFTTRWSWRR